MALIGTSNTKKMVSLLERCTKKPIQIRDIAEFANKPGLAHIANYLGEVKEYSNRIEVHLNFSKPESVCEAVFVHELLHVMLRYQGFPGIATPMEEQYRLPANLVPLLERMRSLFSSTIDHLKIYKVMQAEFNLDSSLYFKDQIDAKLRRFSKFSYKDTPKNAEYYFHIQQDILDGLNYYEFPESFKQQILTVFMETDSDGLASCSALHRKLNKIGYSTPENMFKCANEVKDWIIKYGEKKSVGVVNLLWQAIHVVKDPNEIPLEG